MAKAKPKYKQYHAEWKKLWKKNIKLENKEERILGQAAAKAKLLREQAQDLKNRIADLQKKEFAAQKRAR